MQYLLSSILVFTNINKRKSKLLYIMLFMIVWILIGGCYSNADYAIYLNRYKLSVQGLNLSTEWGFNFLCYLSNQLGFTYQVFLILISLCGLLLMSSTVFRYTSNYGYVLALYFIFPFLLDAVQIRNFFATSIIVYSIRFLISDSNKDTLCYILLVLLAASIHYSMLFCLIFILAKYLHKSNIIIITFSLVILIYIANIGGTDMIFNIASSLANKQVIEEIFHKNFIGYKNIKMIRNSIISTLSIIGFILIKNVVIIKLTKIKDSYNFDGVNLNTKFKYINIITKINILSFVSIPLIFYSIEFYRIQQNLLLLNYIVFSFYFINKKLERKKVNISYKNVFFIISNIVYISIPMYVYIFSSKGNIESVFLSIFNNNLFF